ncbi:MAG TPA: hypothetical protein VGO43_15895 [Pyrinomonadaceae bacterium]|nr:hypothetical protein [Pyrinomonadaceae bacterium]
MIGVITMPLLLLNPIGNHTGEYLWLFLVRVLVWGILARLYFEGLPFSSGRYAITVALGILWSYALDGVLCLLTKEFPDYMQVPFC